MVCSKAPKQTIANTLFDRPHGSIFPSHRNIRLSAKIAKTEDYIHVWCEDIEMTEKRATKSIENIAKYYIQGVLGLCDFWFWEATIFDLFECECTSMALPYRE